MIIVGENLKQLINSYNLIDNEDAFDESCINLTIDNTFIEYEKTDQIIRYQEQDMEKLVKEIEVTKDGYILKSKSAVLICSKEIVNMPDFCFGLVQTKGNLARLFVFATCSDGQIDPGYNGKITLELFNASDFDILFKPGQEVANIYIYNTSTPCKKYSGKFKNANKPTISK